MVKTEVSSIQNNRLFFVKKKIMAVLHKKEEKIQAVILYFCYMIKQKLLITLFICCFCMPLFAKDRILKGRVIYSELYDGGIDNVIVKAVGSVAQAITKEGGTFAISLEKTVKRIQFIYKDYCFEVDVPKNRYKNVILKIDERPQLLSSWRFYTRTYSNWSDSDDATPIKVYLDGSGKLTGLTPNATVQAEAQQEIPLYYNRRNFLLDFFGSIFYVFILITGGK